MGNNLHLNEAKGILAKVKYACARIYRPGMSPQGSLQYVLDWVGDRNAAIGATVLSLLAMLWAFSLFTVLFALFFSVLATIVIFIGAKLIFYKPKEVSFEVTGEETILSFVKDVQLSGESEIVIHSQPGYGKEKNTFVSLQLFDTISVLDCRNITSIRDKTYRDIAVNFFHPIKGDYNIKASSNEGQVTFEILEQSGDHCRVKFHPLCKVVRLDITLN